MLQNRAAVKRLKQLNDTLGYVVKRRKKELELDSP